MSLAQTLRIVFSGDVKAFQEAGSHVEKEANKLAGNLKQIFSAAAATALVAKVIDLADAIADASARTGIGVETWQEWKFAATQSGTTAEALETGIRKLQDTIGATEPTKAQASALDRLGLTFQALKAMAPENQFATVAKAVAGIRDPAERAQLAMELFGKSGTALVPMAGDLDALTAKAHALGQVMSADAVKGLADLKDNLEALKTAVTVSLAWMVDQYGQAWKVLGMGWSALFDKISFGEQATNAAILAEEQKGAEAIARMKAAQADRAIAEKRREVAETKNLTAVLQSIEDEYEGYLKEALKDREAAAKKAALEITQTERDAADTREKIADLEAAKAKDRRDKQLADALAEFDAEIKGYQKQAEEHGAEAAALEAQLAELLKGRGKTSADISREIRQQAHDERDAKRAAAEEEADTQDALDRAKHGYHLSTRQRYLVEVAKKREALAAAKEDEDAALAAAKQAAADKAAAEQKARQDEVKAHREAQDAMLAKLQETLAAMLTKIKELTGGDYTAPINATADTEAANTALNGTAADRTAKFAAAADTTQAQSEIDKLSSNTVKIPAILDPPELKAALDLTLNAPLAEISSTLSTWLPQIDTDIKAIVGTAA